MNAIGVHMSPPSCLSPISLPILGSYRAPEFAETNSKFPLAICFTYSSVSFSLPLSIRLPAPTGDRLPALANTLSLPNTYLIMAFGFLTFYLVSGIFNRK